MKTEVLNTIYNLCKEPSLAGRYIHGKHINPLLKKHAKNFKIEVIGTSVLGEDIHSVTLGSGEKKILMWSQMHGNESTTTKALFDLFNFFVDANNESKAVLKSCTIVIIPILNPDGAKAYTRINANKVDLNRDAQNLTQPESVVLNKVFNTFKPHYCFNLHGQRTIFSAGSANKTASLSFLAPAQDKNCVVTDSRKVSMSIITKMNTMLQQEIPACVGTYDDAYNINCVGDAFQSLNVPTILFEAGHYANDYGREEVRRMVFNSYLVALKTITEESIVLGDYKAYLHIPEKGKLFFDIIIKNALFGEEVMDIAVQYQETLVNGEVCFLPKIEKIEKLNAFFAHKYVDAGKNRVLDIENNLVVLGYTGDVVLINNERISLKVS